MIGDVFEVFGVSVICAISALLLKRAKSDIAFGVVVAAMLCIFFFLLNSFDPILSSIIDLISLGEASEYAEPMLKALGIAFITQIASEICSECGEKSIGNGVEFAGKIEILLLCIPLVEKMIGYAMELVSLK